MARWPVSFSVRDYGYPASKVSLDLPRQVRWLCDRLWDCLICCSYEKMDVSVQFSIGHSGFSLMCMIPRKNCWLFPCTSTLRDNGDCFAFVQSPRKKEWIHHLLQNKLYFIYSFWRRTLFCWKLSVHCSPMRYMPHTRQTVSFDVALVLEEDFLTRVF